MGEKQGSEIWQRLSSSRWFKPGLIAGGVVLGVVLVCIVGLGIVALVERASMGTGRSQTDWAQAPGMAPMEREVVVEKMAVEMDAASTSTGNYGMSDMAYAAERLIIRSGNISMSVKDTLAAQGSVEQMVASMAAEGAFVISSEAYGGGEDSQPYVTMSIRIPASRFDETMDRLEELAVQVTNRNESAQDVTEEYVDLTARLESLEAARQRLLEIMQSASNTKDLLEAEQQLTQRETEIESLKGRIQYLEQSAQLSSIWIELQPYILSQPVGDQWRPLETVRHAVEALLDGLRGMGNFLIFFAIAILPWFLVLGLVIWGIVRLIRWRVRASRRKSAAAGQSSGQEG